jgi:hypothetical protein
MSNVLPFAKAGDPCVNSTFEKHCFHIIFDAKFLTKVKVYEQQFVNKNDTHIAFFGGNLMGVHPVRFKDEDRNRWFNEVMDADEDSLEDDLHALPAILPHRHVSSDVMNLSCFWMAHKFLTSPLLTEQQRYEGALASILVVQYKFITSILTDWFRYNADPIIAQATYAALNKRFGLKVAGSWGALLRIRAAAVVGKGELHYKELLSFLNDDKVVYMVNDTQGRIKDILKNIRDVFTIVKNSPEMQIRTSSSMIEMDGELKVRDKTRLVSTYMRYILEVLPDKNSFMVPELIDVIAKTVPTMPKSSLQATLQYMSANSSPRADKDVQQLCTVVLQHAFNYLARNPNVMENQSDIGGLLKKMRALYQASRTNDPQILEMRELAEGIARRTLKSKNGVLIAAVRNAVLLYILLRTFTMKHYRQ